MLPEHVEMIKQLWAEEDYKEKPILSDQQLEENEFILQEALQNNSPVRIKYFKSHDFHFIEGNVSKSSDHLIINGGIIKLVDILEIH